MPVERPPVEPLTTAEANRRFYAAAAETYDGTEECVVDPRLRRRLRNALERALDHLPADPRALDACGGSGNVSLLLHELGVRPMTVDVSPEMLAIYERKAQAHGWSASTYVAPIETFLAEDSRTWDLIVFSSALHHLEDYERVLELAARRLAPGGLVFTIFDPARVDAVGRRIRRLDYIAHVLLKTPRRVPRVVAARVTRRGGPAEEQLNARAERHALVGIDDSALRRRLERGGLEILVHDRTYEGRFRLTRLAYRVLGHPSSFHLVARRPPTGRNGGSTYAADDRRESAEQFGGDEEPDG